MYFPVSGVLAAWGLEAVTVRGGGLTQGACMIPANGDPRVQKAYADALLWLPAERASIRST